MPELPEVETVKRGLEKSIKGKKVKSAIIRCKKLRYEFPDKLDESLLNRTIEDIERRSKYLLLKLDDGNYLVIHLGMSGKILIHDKQLKDFAKHDHFIINFTDGSQLVFNDARRFGLIDLVANEELKTSRHFKDLGPEPLEKGFNGKYLKTYFKDKTKAVKVILMDASCVVGVGNIYVSESLFETNIAPTKSAGKIKQERLDELAKNIKLVLKKAIKSGGSTLRDYVRSDGDIGYFQHQFKVYGRENKPCYSCGTSIKRITQQGRSTFFCPHCQKN